MQPHAPEIAARDYLTGDRFTLAAAPPGWWVTRPAPADLGRYYPPFYYGAGASRRFPWPVEWLQTLLYLRRARLVTGAVGRCGRVLDIGCGPGHLLVRFRRMGWETVGTETPDAAAAARRTQGLDVRSGDDALASLPDASFDAVVSWHSLEHMRDPVATLDQIARLLRPDGVVLVSVPNFSSAEAQAAPASWFHLDVPRHLFHFPADVLRRQLEQRGFRIEFESFRAPEYDAFSLVQTWQNRMGFRHNLLYMLLKGASWPGSGTSLVERAGVFLLALAQLPFAALLATARGCGRRGAVVVLVARKAGSR